MSASKDLMAEIYQAGHELLEDIALRQERYLENIHTFMADIIEAAARSDHPDVQARLREFSTIEVEKRLSALEAMAALLDDGRGM